MSENREETPPLGSVEVGNIGNDYGGLTICKKDGKFFWSVENWDGFMWEEIPEELYNALAEFEEGRKGNG